MISPTGREVEIEPTPTAEMGEESGETDNEPFLEIEWPEENALHQLHRLRQRRDDFDFGCGAVHGDISIAPVQMRKHFRAGARHAEARPSGGKCFRMSIKTSHPVPK
jgi:hypothetical protein